MSIFSKLAEFFSKGLSRKKRDEEWAARFTNPPADPNRGRLPLDPGKSDLS